MVHRQTPARLHGNPVAQIGAEVGLGWWQPIAWVLVALRLVDAVGHREERPRIRRVVGVRASHAWRPRPCTRIPRLFERNDVIDVDARRIRPTRTVVGRNPVPCDHVAIDRVDLRERDAVALEHLVTRVAAVTVDVSPMFERRPRVPSRTLTLDDDSLQDEERRPAITNLLVRQRVRCSSSRRCRQRDDNDRAVQRETPLHG